MLEAMQSNVSKRRAQTYKRQRHCAAVHEPHGRSLRARAGASWPNTVQGPSSTKINGAIHRQRVSKEAINPRE